MEDEEWVPVFGYEDAYLIDKSGNIKSLTRKTRQSGNLVKQYYICRKNKISPDDFNKYHDYKRVILWNAELKKNTNHYVHRLVWESFKGKIPDGMQINHINEIKDDNRLENLGLVTPKENINYGTAHIRTVEKETYSEENAQKILNSKFNNNIDIIKYNGVKGVGTFKCSVCDGIFKKIFDDERHYNGNGCPNCNRSIRISRHFDKIKSKLNDKFKGNIIFTDTQYTGSRKLYHFKCLTCGAIFSKRYDQELALLGNGHPHCPKLKKQI